MSRKPLLRSQAHIYVIEFTGGRIKVGFTHSPAKRINDHTRAGAGFGHPVLRSWVSPEHWEASANEVALIKFCAGRRGSTRSGEFFRVDYELALGFAMSLPMNQIPQDVVASHLARQSAAADGLFRSVYGLFGQLAPDAQGSTTAADTQQSETDPCAECGPYEQNLEGNIEYAKAIQGDSPGALAEVCGNSDDGIGFVSLAVTNRHLVDDSPPKPARFVEDAASMCLSPSAAALLGAALLRASAAASDRGALAGNHDHCIDRSHPVTQGGAS